MHAPSHYTETSQQTNRFSGRSIGARLVPMLHSHLCDYGWQGGPLYGDGGSTLYLWFFGRTFRIRELEHWES